MAQKHLHELLNEAQEPFFLKNYIADRRSLLKKSNSQKNKIKPISKNSLCKNSCFFSHTRSPNYTNSPFSNVPSPAPKSRAQLKFTNFDISLLVESAERITNSNSGKSQKGKGGFGVFGSIVKKLLQSRVKCEKIETLGFFLQNEDFEMEFDCSCSSSRRDSGGESLERESDGFSLSEKYFWSSPVSTFLNSLQNSPSTSLRSPEYSPSTPSPILSDIQDDGKVECTFKNVLEEEEKDQFSPVSILDPPFEDDSEKLENEDDEDHDFDIECSYAAVQRAKDQLLERLLRFEKLAELDPVELERSILETISDGDDDEELEGYKNDISETNTKFGTNRNMLVLGLIAKGKRKGDGIGERKIAANHVCKKNSLWEKKEFKTRIDMMVEFDLRREVDDSWKANDQELLQDTAAEIELSIFELLVKEFL